MERTRIYWKRILKIIGFLCVLGIAGYLLFPVGNLRAESASSKELAKEIQKIKDVGEPTTVEELVPLDIPDGENGALVYNQAFYLLKELKGRYKEEWKYVPIEGEVKWDSVPEVKKEKVKDLLLNNPDFVRFYQLLEKASGMKCQFLERNDYERGSTILLSHLALLRSCARMLAARADIQAENGEIDNALHDCLIGLKMSGSLSEEPILISGLVRIAIDQIVLVSMEEIMRKGEAQSGTYRVLMKEIMRERNDKMVYRGLLGERVLFGMVEFPRLKSQIKEKGDFKSLVELFFGSSEGKEQKELYDTLADATQKDPAVLLEENELVYLQTIAKLVALSKKPYLEAKEGEASLEKELSGLLDEKAVLAKMLIPALFQAPTKETRLDAYLGNAEIALACHLYKAKNKNYPVSLKELSPEFLPKPLLDPFTRKGYIYQKTDKGFKVYSLGDNLKDDGGQQRNKPKQWEGDYDIVWEE